MQSYISDVFMTGIMSDWVMSTIEDNLATLRDPRSVQAWIQIFKAWTRREKLKYD